ncbi:MAG: peptidase T4 [Rhizobiaceae bacterium]|nr:peptidase T4 [Rhizobiaceae bacterium]
MSKPGPRNLITDIAGLRVGNADDAKVKSGTTALICDVENTASVHVMGGAPGSRETDLLSPENTVQSVDAFFLSGGSAFGLEAGTGLQSALVEQNRGFEIHGLRVPIIPGAIIFDLTNGGDVDWGTKSPYADLGYQAAQNAAEEFDIGSHGAGYGAWTGGPGPGLKGGLGSASTIMPNGVTIGALTVVNALGAPTVGNSPCFWAAPFEHGDEFGGLGCANVPTQESRATRIKFRDNQAYGANTVIGIIATDAPLTKAECKRLAVLAHDGIARALWPAHTPLDGDLVFAVSTGAVGNSPTIGEQIEMSAIAASTMSRAVARGVHAAKHTEGDLFPSWAKAFGRD